MAAPSKPTAVGGCAPVYTSMFGRKAVIVSRLADLRAAIESPDLERGRVSGSLPVAWLLRTLFAHPVAAASTEGWFFNMLEETDPARKEARARTLAIITAPGPSTPAEAAAEAGRAVAALMVQGDKPAARRATIQFVLRKFNPSIVVTEAMVGDMAMASTFFPPSWRIVSPLHWWWQAAAKERLLAAMGGNFDLVHHSTAALGLWKVAETVATPAFAARVAAATAGGGAFHVLRAFDTAEPLQNIFVAKTATTLGGALPTPIGPGGLVVFQLACAAEFSDSRFMPCSGQRLLTDFIQAVVAAHYPGAALAPVTFAPRPLYPAVTVALTRSEVGSGGGGVGDA